MIVVAEVPGRERNGPATGRNSYDSLRRNAPPLRRNRHNLPRVRVRAKTRLRLLSRPLLRGGETKRLRQRDILRQTPTRPFGLPGVKIKETTMDSLTIEIVPDSRLSKNGLRKSNWRVSQGLMKQAREDAYMLGLAEMGDDWQTPEKATVQVTQYYARRPLDFDGLACIVAPTLDGLVDCGVLFDDDPGHIAGYGLGHVKVATMGENRVAITVTPVSE